MLPTHSHRWVSPAGQSRAGFAGEVATGTASHAKAGRGSSALELSPALQKEGKGALVLTEACGSAPPPSTFLTGAGPAQARTARPVPPSWDSKATEVVCCLPEGRGKEEQSENRAAFLQ